MPPLSRAKQPLSALLQWRALQAADMPALCALAAQAHPNLPESAAVLAEKQQLAPNFCFALERAAGAAQGKAQFCGYLLAHPWAAGHIAKLNRPLSALPQSGGLTLYLHDLAIAPQARGQKAAALGVARLCAAAAKAGFSSVSLVAVHGTAPFWQKQGFAAEQPAQAERAVLKAYGADARFMVKYLAPVS